MDLRLWRSTRKGGVWRLTYAGCGHHQEFPGLWREDLDKAVGEAIRYYGCCLTCRLLDAQRRRADRAKASSAAPPAPNGVTHAHDAVRL
jgi:hypothetical protein